MSLPALLAEIDDLLATRRPKVRAHLRAGATPDALARLGQVPRDLVAFFAWHDGQDGLRALSSETSWFLHSIESSLEASTYLANPDEEPRGPWKWEWIPILDNGAGDHLVFDRTSGALIEYRHDDDEREQVHASLAEWAEAVRDELDAQAAPIALPAPQRFVLAVGGVLTEMNDGDHTRLGAAPFPSASEDAAMILRESWSIRTGRDAAESLETLLTRGNRSRYEAKGHGPAATIAAWDLGRAVSLAGWTYVAGLLDRDVAWAFALRAARMAQAAFSSWEAFGASYVKGRSFWAEEPDQEATAAIAQLRAPGGLWSEVAWTTAIDGDLAPPDDAREVIEVTEEVDLGEVIADAPSNARIVLAAGTYEGPFEIDDSIELCAAPGAEVVITGDETPVVLIEDGGVFCRGLTFRTGDDEDLDAIHTDGGRLVLDHCTVSASRYGLDLLSGQSEVAVKDARFVACATAPILVESGYVTIERTEIEGGSAVCLQITGEADAAVDHCRIHDGGGSGIVVAEKAEVIVTDCEIAGMDSHGVQIGDEAKVELVRVHVHHTVAGVLLDEQCQVRIDHCRIHDQQGSAVFARTTPSVRVQDSELGATAEPAVMAAAGAKVQVLRVVIDGGEATGLQAEGATLHAVEVTAKNLGDTGFHVGEGGTLTADRCIATGNANNGATAGDGGALTLGDCRIEGNTNDGVFAYDGGTCRLVGGEVKGGVGVAIRAESNGVVTIHDTKVLAGEDGDEHAEDGGRIERPQSA